MDKMDKMEYRIVKRVSKKELEQIKHLNSEFIYRQMVQRLIEEMPIEAFSRVFKLEKMDYESNEAKILFKDGIDADRNYLRMLREQEVVEYKVSLKTSSRDIQYKQEVSSEPIVFNQLIQLNKEL